MTTKVRIRLPKYAESDSYSFVYPNAVLNTAYIRGLFPAMPQPVPLQRAVGRAAQAAALATQQAAEKQQFLTWIADKTVRGVVGQLRDMLMETVTAICVLVWHQRPLAADRQANLEIASSLIGGSTKKARAVRQYAAYAGYAALLELRLSTDALQIARPAARLSLSMLVYADVAFDTLLSHMDELLTEVDKAMARTAATAQISRTKLVKLHQALTERVKAGAPQPQPQQTANAPAAGQRSAAASGSGAAGAGRSGAAAAGSAKAAPTHRAATAADGGTAADSRKRLSRDDADGESGQNKRRTSPQSAEEVRADARDVLQTAIDNALHGWDKTAHQQCVLILDHRLAMQRTPSPAERQEQLRVLRGHVAALLYDFADIRDWANAAIRDVRAATGKWMVGDATEGESGTEAVADDSAQQQDMAGQQAGAQAREDDGAQQQNEAQQAHEDDGADGDAEPAEDEENSDGADGDAEPAEDEENSDGADGDAEPAEDEEKSDGADGDAEPAEDEEMSVRTTRSSRRRSLAGDGEQD